MRFARCIGNGGSDVVFLFFHGLLSPFLNVDAPENIIVFCAVSGARNSKCLKIS